MEAEQSNSGRILAAAVDYAEECGWAVLAVHGIRDGRCSCMNPECRAPGKHPLLKQWQKLATRDVAAIRKWWKAFPDADLGVLTGRQSGGLAVVDIDGAAGRASAKCLGLPRSARSRTGGGMHMVYRCEGEIPRRVGFRRGIDILGEGSFFIAPPSRHTEVSEGSEVLSHTHDISVSSLSHGLAADVRCLHACPVGLRSSVWHSHQTAGTRRDPA